MDLTERHHAVRDASVGPPPARLCVASDGSQSIIGSSSSSSTLAAPTLSTHSASTGDSGCSGRTGCTCADDTESVTSSGSCGSSSSISSSGCGDSDPEEAAKRAVRKALDLASPVAVGGDITIEGSTNVQIGNNTHYHGPVTVLLTAGGDAIQGLPVASLLQQQQRRQLHECGLVPGDPGCGDRTLATTLFAAPPRQYPLLSVSPAAAATLSASQKELCVLDGEEEVEEPYSRFKLLKQQIVRHRKYITIYASIIVTLVPLVVLICLMTLQENIPQKFDNGLSLVTRAGWMAQSPRPGIGSLKTPVEFVILHHSGSATCSSFPECMRRTRDIQMFNMERNGWLDIAYNFLVGGDCNAYEGRGWDRAGSHTLNWNDRAIGIALIGTFSRDKPSSEQLRSVRRLIEVGVSLGKILPEYKLIGGCQLRNTGSPGRFVLEEIVRWDHWWNYTEPHVNCSTAAIP